MMIKSKISFFMFLTANLSENVDNFDLFGIFFPFSYANVRTYFFSKSVKRITIYRRQNGEDESKLQSFFSRSVLANV